jgi:aldehyde oxidoreductase
MPCPIEAMEPEVLKKTLTINGLAKTVIVDPETSLGDVLRKQLYLTGTKVYCGDGHCGACNVMVDGRLVIACMTRIDDLRDEAEITTVEGIGTPTNLDPVQLALVAVGAPQCGFCMPGFVVSTKALLKRSPNPTREQVRSWFTRHHNACRCNGYKPIVDAVMAAAAVQRGELDVSELEFTMPADGRIWGTSYPRPSAIAKVTGTLDYGQDLGLRLPPGTLHIAMVQAKVSHANIKGVDVAEAERMPGVVKVVTAKDIKGSNAIGGLNDPNNLGSTWDRPILCDSKVFQFGDAIALVCADTPEQAEAAAEKVVVDLEELPAYLSAPAAMAEDAIEIHPGYPNIYFTQKLVKGEDPKPLLDSAPHVVQDDFYLQRQPHLTIEGDVGFAYYDEEGRLTIHSKSIFLYGHALMIAPGLGVEMEKLRLVQNPAGGTFGYKFSPTLEALVGAATMATGRPCYLEYDYYQSITYTGKRSPFWMNVRLGADSDGRLVGMETDFVVDHGPYSEFGDLLTKRGVQFIGAGYDIPNIRGRGRTVATNHAFGSAFRAYGSPQSFFASESLIDELAEKVGVDPFEFRLKNVYRPGATTPNGQEPEVFPYPQIFDIMRPHYETAKKRAAEESTPEVRKGVGLAMGIYGCGLDGVDGAEVHIELTKDGVTVYDNWHDHGQGADIGTLGTTHEALLPLGLTPTKIKLVMNDMAVTPNGGPAGGSRSQVMIGQAIKDGCEKLIEAMRRPDGTFRTYEEMVAEGLDLKYVGKYSTTNRDIDTEGHGTPFTIYMYTLFLAEVAVDTRTGKTTVEHYTAVTDIGKLNNKLVVDGQMYGGIAQGIGLALSEDFEDLEKHTNLRDCGLPYAKDIPDDIKLFYVETPRELGPFGAAGVGEAPLTASHVAVVNAIKNATGVRITRLPALPEKVLAGLQRLAAQA